MRERHLKQTVIKLLGSKSLPDIHAALGQHDEQQLLNSLFSGICRSDETTKWHAVAAMGPVLARLADRDMEAARVVMRRFMWSLNDESGGIGWGAPEAMAEALACHPGLAAEYTHILVAFMREDGFFIEYEPLQRGLMWAVGRLAEGRPELLRAKDAARYLAPYLEAQDATVRGLAARALGSLDAKEVSPAIANLRDDQRPVRYWQTDRMVTKSVAELASAALAKLAA